MAGKVKWVTDIEKSGLINNFEERKSPRDRKRGLEFLLDERADHPQCL